MTYSPLPSIAPRLDLAFDDGWRFQRGQASGFQKLGFDDHSWRKVDLPHDWSIEDLPAEERQPLLPFQAGTWRFKAGDRKAWRNPKFNDSAWKRVQAPHDWRNHKKKKERPAWGTYRRELVLPPELEGRDFCLDLGLIGEVNEAYLNGRLIGRTGSFPPRFKLKDWWLPYSQYPVKAAWLKARGPNILVLRVYSKMDVIGWHCQMGRGGLLGNSPEGEASGPFDALSVSSWATGYTVGGRGCYRKQFQAPAAWRGREVSVTFDGIYMDAQVFCNGRLLARQPYGYTHFTVPLKGLRYGAENVLSVLVRNDGMNSRWYSGSGIYRHVRLTVTDKLHIARHGVSITTPQVHAQLATVKISTELSLPGGPQPLRLITSLYGPDGRRVATATADVLAHDGAPIEQSLRVEKPALWSPESPSLYSAKVQLHARGRNLDAWAGHFGIRSIDFSAQAGFRLNGQKTLLYGGCVHHDHGILGSRAFDAAEERRVRVMKANGFNAIRTSHNPPSQALIQACERLGMLVIDESFDQWRNKTNSHDYHRFHKRWWKRDLSALILRDRNSPAVIMWSIGNEIANKLKPATGRVSREQALFARALDPSRPVTEALNGKDHEWLRLDAYNRSHDVHGYNYMEHWYRRDHERVPERVVYQSESANQKIFESCTAMQELPQVTGDFVWTGWDYIGEASIGWFSFDMRRPQNKKWTLAYCGDLDLLGHARPQNLYRRTVWGSGPKLSILVKSPSPSFGKRWVGTWSYDDVHPHWNWPGDEGKKLRVELYSRCEKVELFLNGRRIGRKETGKNTRYKALFRVPYRPGTLSAVGYVGGKVAERVRLDTAGKAAALRLTPEKRLLKAGGQDLGYVHVEVVDARGRRVPQATDRIRVEVKGAASQAGFGTANPINLESFQDAEHPAFEGRALLVVRTGKGSGEAVIRAEAPGLKPARLRLQVRR